MYDRMPYFLIVKDTKHDEWTFVCGGCKLRETNTDAASRELKEETKGAIDIEVQSETCTMCFLHNDCFYYTVYFVNLNDYNIHKENVENLIKTYKECTMRKKEYNETCDISFVSRNDLNKVDMWSFMRNHIVPNIDRHIRAYVKR